MPQITDIKPQKKEKRFNIFVDGRFAFGLDADTLVKSGLKINQEISKQEIDKLIKENEFGKAYERVLKFFSYRPRSEKELKDWFIKKQVGDELQKMISQKLKDLGYLNDEEFAKWWIDQRTSFRPAGIRFLIMELRQKGISKEIISHITSHISQTSERDLASRIVEKKLKSLKHLSGLELRQKLAALLSRRGFNWEIIKEVLNSVLTKD